AGGGVQLDLEPLVEDVTFDQCVTFVAVSVPVFPDSGREQRGEALVVLVGVGEAGHPGQFGVGGDGGDVLVQLVHQEAGRGGEDSVLLGQPVPDVDHVGQAAAVVGCWRVGRGGGFGGGCGHGG